jgi:hypothetical protein
MGSDDDNYEDTGSDDTGDGWVPDPSLDGGDDASSDDTGDGWVPDPSLDAGDDAHEAPGYDTGDDDMGGDASVYGEG